MKQREHIVDRAMRMFVAQGIKSVRMDDIARALGVSKRTLYELFGDKERLLYLALARYFEVRRAGWLQVCAGARDELERLFRVLCDVMDSSETTCRMMDDLRRFYPAVHDRLMREGMENNRRELRGMLERGIAAGLFTSDFNIDLAISVLYYTASALLARGGELLLPEGLSEREAVVQIIGSFFRGISTAEGVALIDDYQRRYEPAQKRG